MEGVCEHRLALTRQPLDNAWWAEPGALVAREVEAPAPFRFWSRVAAAG